MVTIILLPMLLIIIISPYLIKNIYYNEFDFLNLQNCFNKLYNNIDKNKAII